MKIPDRRQTARVRVARLNAALAATIANVVSEDEDYTYAEILLALGETIQQYGNAQVLSETTESGDN